METFPSRQSRVKTIYSHPVSLNNPLSHILSFSIFLFTLIRDYSRDIHSYDNPYNHTRYGGRGQREDFTMGVSFGAERELEFLHPESGSKFAFPQKNLDVFAFDSDVNARFQHGVPRPRNGRYYNHLITLLSNNPSSPDKP